MALEMKILNGPSKWDIMLALFDNTARAVRTVKFTCDQTGLPTRDFEVSIDSVLREDGSGESWEFTGHVGFQSVKGCFNTVTRKGHFTF